MKNQNANIKRNELIQFYSTGSSGSGVSVVKSQVKLNILSLLTERALEFEKIVNELSKSKSTVSSHLNDLRKEGVISFKFKPNDQRKKIFFIRAKFLGEVEATKSLEFEEQRIQELIRAIINSEGEIVEFSRLFFHTFRSTLMQEGLTIDPLFYETGLKIGKSIYEVVKTEDFRDFADNVSAFWENHDLGRLKIELISDNEVGIDVKDCFECELLPNTGKAACFMDLGILESLFSESFRKEVILTETHCYAMGDDHCYFELQADSGNHAERSFGY